MKQSQLWSLRLGFSGKQADWIEKHGVEKLVRLSAKVDLTFKASKKLASTPKTIPELQAFRKKVRKQKEQSILKALFELVVDYKSETIARCNQAEYPLGEKLSLFWQNHFVSTFKKVKVPYWMYEYDQVIRKHAFGNYKTLVKEMMYSNAMLTYLDNNQNQRDKLNENLGRELLELFTLGEGNYTETDIRETAKALAGLTVASTRGRYRPFLKDNSIKTVLGRRGNLIIDDVVDVIFEQENTPYFITEKLLRWFIYDKPPQELVLKYGKRFKELQFEIAPFLAELFAEEYEKDTAGSHIKNPLEFALQSHHALQIEPNYVLLAFYVHSQGMDLFDQVNVKGWLGGQDWLTTQTYIARHELIDFLLTEDDKILRKIERNLKRKNLDLGQLKFTPKWAFSKQAKAREIKQDMTDRLLFATNEDITEGMEQIMRYDFEASVTNADETVKQLFRYVTQLPEFQLI